MPVGGIISRQQSAGRLLRCCRTASEQEGTAVDGEHGAVTKRLSIR